MKKKIISVIVLFFFLFNGVFSYTLTNNDKIILDKIYIKIDSIYEKNPSKIDKLKVQILSLQKTKNLNDRANFIFDEIINYIENLQNSQDDEIQGLINDVIDSDSSSSNVYNGSCQSLSSIISNYDKTSVTVNNLSELTTAFQTANTRADQNKWYEIIINKGTYNLSNGFWTTGNKIIFRGATGNPKDVILKGTGMKGGVSHGFWTIGSNIIIGDLSVGNVANHAIQVMGERNSDNILIHNVEIFDTGEQMIKGSFDKTKNITSDNSVVECSKMYYTNNYGPQYYIGGIDVHSGKNWIVRNNYFENIRSPESNIAEHAIHFWTNSENTLVEGNTIINCDRGIGFGLGSSGHIGGIIKNNLIYHDSTSGDVGIGLENASQAKVYNNTIYFEHSYNNAIEYRFTGTNAEIINNLTNKNITQREGGIATLKTNITNVQKNWFTNISNNDFSLTSNATQAENKGTSLSEVKIDIKGITRSNTPDIGAFENNGDISETSTENNINNDNQTNNKNNGNIQTGLVQPSDVEYLGAFRLPGASGLSNWNYAGGSDYGGGDSTYYPNGDKNGPSDGHPGSIFSYGHANDLMVSEITIPKPIISKNKNLSDLNTATTIQNFSQIRDFELEGEGTPYMAGLEYLPKQGNQTSDKLYHSRGRYFQFDGGFPSIAMSELNLSNPDTKGPWYLGSKTISSQRPHNMSISAFIFEIPKSWADIYTPGKYLVTGRYSTLSFGGGPSLYAFGPWNEGNPPADYSELNYTNLLQYTSSNTYNGYTSVDRWMGGAWLTTQDNSAVILSGIKGVGDYWYGFQDGTRYSDCTIQGGTKNCDYSIVGQRGRWCEDYDGLLAFYDPNDFVKVINGDLKSYDPQPYATLNLDQFLFHLNSGNHDYSRLGSMSYDRERNIIYVIEKFGDGEKPLIHVFKINNIKHSTQNTITCSNNQHLSGNVCINNTRSCGITNGVGIQNWTGNTWGSCVINYCNSGYVENNGNCILNTNTTPTPTDNNTSTNNNTTTTTKPDNLDISQITLVDFLNKYKSGIYSKEDIKKISLTEFQNVSTYYLSLLYKEDNLTYYITTEQLQQIDMSKESIYGQYFTYEQFKNVTQEQLNEMVPNNYPYLSPENISKIKAENFNKVSTRHLSNMNNSKNVTNLTYYITAEQLQQIDMSKESIYGQYFTYEQFNNVTQEQLNEMVPNNYSYLSPENVSKIKAENFNKVTSWHLSNMKKSNNLSGLTTEQKQILASKNDSGINLYLNELN